MDKNASRMSFLEVSISGDVEKRSVKFVGVHDDGSKEATDSVTLAVDNRPGRIKLKSYVGFEVTALVGIGVHGALETVVAGERHFWANRLRVSILGGMWDEDRVGMAL